VRASLCGALALASTVAFAFDESGDGERGVPPSHDEAIAWKLTGTYYHTTNERGAGDV
jgi:hypothetical protein